jgi:hypothetical protein
MQNSKFKHYVVAAAGLNTAAPHTDVASAGSVCILHFEF